MIMGKLRHIAFISKEPKKLSDFYQKFFDLEEIKVFPSGSRMVIDGLFNLAFLQQNVREGRSHRHPPSGRQRGEPNPGNRALRLHGGQPGRSRCKVAADP